MSTLSQVKASGFRLKSLIAVGAAAMVLLSAGPAHAVGGKPAVDKSTLVVALPAEPGNLDPQVAPSVDSAKFAWNVFDTLYGFDRTGKLEPRLATDHKVSADGLVHTFTLREGVKFQNGAAFTSADVKYSIERIIEPATKSTRRPYFAPTVDKVETPDDKTVIIRLKQADGAFINKVAGYLYIVPKAYTQGLATPEAFAQAPIGTGPYRIVGHEVGRSLELQRFDGYWGKAPAIKTIRYRFIPEPSSRVNAVLSGEVDLVTDVAASDAEQLKTHEGISVTSIPGGSPLHVRIYSKEPGTPLSKPDVRLALNYAIDKNALIKSVYRGRAATLSSTIPSSYPYGSNPDLQPYPYDPAKAKALLAKAGYPKGFQTSVYFPAAFPRALGEAVVAYWGQVGIKVQLKTLDYVAFNRINNVHQSGPLAFSEFGNAIYDPIHVIGGSVSKDGTWSDYYNPEVQKLIDEVDGVSDLSRRDALFKQILKLTHDDGQAVLLAEVFLNYAKDSTLQWDPQVAGWSLNFRDASWK
ncbi:ABC transporter substrate-binding protein [Bordetella genomosp. 10]|uniref:ABC transporter substrate-binding protein n=1 Tax=Bordetella genomosp. 10 TaxID=1416804 RepID=A0A261SBW9_9BORD|nr:ABC transporter substrate-binding protein [Bordetella genomosp. 10]OZI34655.1 ABC transporter substrate-binding protein [Bordetella genomosp. 10]